MQALDIIQECVTINHQIKKKSIKIKSSPVKYVGKYPRLHTPQADFIDDEDIATGSIKHSIIKPGTPQSKGKRGILLYKDVCACVCMCMCMCVQNINYMRYCDVFVCSL
jgi:hypothetical protein